MLKGVLVTKRHEAHKKQNGPSRNREVACSCREVGCEVAGCAAGSTPQHHSTNLPTFDANTAIYIIYKLKSKFRISIEFQNAMDTKYDRASRFKLMWLNGASTLSYLNPRKRDLVLLVATFRRALQHNLSRAARSSEINWSAVLGIEKPL